MATKAKVRPSGTMTAKKVPYCIVLFCLLQHSLRVNPLGTRRKGDSSRPHRRAKTAVLGDTLLTIRSILCFPRGSYIETITPVQVVQATSRRGYNHATPASQKLQLHPHDFLFPPRRESHVLLVQAQGNDVVFVQQGHDSPPKAGRLADLHHQKIEDG